MRALARIFGVLPTVRYHLVDVQPGLFADSTAGASVSRPAPGTTTGRAAPASCEADPAATPVARAASGVSRMLGHQRLHSESLGSELAGPALPLHPHPDFLAKEAARTPAPGARCRIRPARVEYVVAQHYPGSG